LIIIDASKTEMMHFQINFNFEPKNSVSPNKKMKFIRRGGEGREGVLTKERGKISRFYRVHQKCLEKLQFNGKINMVNKCYF
jgi:hypothetical protein